MTVRSRSRQTLGGSATATHVHIGGTALVPLTMRMDQVDQSMVDHVVPNFAQLVADGAVIVNPVSNVKVHQSRTGGGSYWATTGSRVSTISGGSLTTFWRTRVSPCASITLTEPANLVSGVQHSAVSRIDATPYAFAEDVATTRETVDLLGNPMRELAGLGKSFSKEVSGLMLRNRWLTRAQAVAQVYLQYRFAITPALHSADNLIKSLYIYKQRARRRTATATTTWSDQKSDQIGTSSVYARTAKAETKAVAGVIYEVSNPIDDWRFRYGFRNKDIPRLMWDLVPYSFMVDRVSNIGDSISGLTNLLDPGLSILGAWTSVKSTKTTGESLIGQVSSGWTISISPDWDYVETSSYTRSKWIPTLANAVPGVNLEGLVSSSTKIADLAALIIQRFK